MCVLLIALCPEGRGGQSGFLRCWSKRTTPKWPVTCILHPAWLFSILLTFTSFRPRRWVPTHMSFTTFWPSHGKHLGRIRDRRQGRHFHGRWRSLLASEVRRQIREQALAIRYPSSCMVQSAFQVTRAFLRASSNAILVVERRDKLASIAKGASSPYFQAQLSGKNSDQYSGSCM